MLRWAELFGVPLAIPDAHPMRTVEALRATLLVGVDPRVVDGFYRAYWIEGRPPSDEKTMRDVLGAAGHDADAILPRLDEMKDDLRVRTDEAIALGIFGAPAFVVAGELYWGQDRIAFVEEALRKERANANELERGTDP
jgi:2-hydroxychromene-2-carboxylate isomerase